MLGSVLGRRTHEQHSGNGHTLPSPCAPHSVTVDADGLGVLVLVTLGRLLEEYDRVAKGVRERVFVAVLVLEIDRVAVLVLEMDGVAALEGVLEADPMQWPYPNWHPAPQYCRPTSQYPYCKHGEVAATHRCAIEHHHCKVQFMKHH